MSARRRRADDSGASGLVLVDKPAGWTSHDVVGWLRPRLGTRRVGHAGTLDPLASGLLPCLAGPATRLVDALHGWPKTYVGHILLGLETESGDSEGAPEGYEPDVPSPPRAVLETVLERLRGPLEQVPPALSAKKIRGTPAHRIARGGGTPILPPVSVTVHAFRVVPAGRGRLAFAARVSAGTYIRSLARDLGRGLGTGAILESLRRTGVGPLRVRGALVPVSGTPEPLEAHRLRPLEEIPLPLPTYQLQDEEQLRAFLHGNAVPFEPESEGGEGRVLDPAGRLLGLGVLGEGGELRPRRVLAPPPS